MIQKNLKNWQNDKLYADIFKARSLGKLPEMESSKAAAKKLSVYFRDGYSVLDVGCGAGHYLKSYERVFKGKKFTYIGLDIAKEYIDIAKEVFAGKENVKFLIGSVYKLPFRDNEFDIVVCNNVLLHLPEIKRALKELTRVAKKAVIIRTLAGNRSFYIKDTSVQEGKVDPLKIFNRKGEPNNFNYYNIYSERYIKAVANSFCSGAKIRIEPDNDFNEKKISDNKGVFKNRQNATRLVNGMQVNGYIILPWSFVTIIKS